MSILGILYLKKILNFFYNFFVFKFSNFSKILFILVIFRNNNVVSTTENLAVYLYHQIKMKLKPPEILKKVVVGETNKNRFSYSGG